MIRLIISALFPSIVLMAYIYKKDQIEKEPFPLLAKLFFLGMLCVIPTIIMELFLGAMLNLFLSPGTRIYLVLENFVVIALVEEFWKYWAVRLPSWNHPAFNFRFDAIVYGVFGAMGFAALENIMYVRNYGFSVSISRAVTAVPAHAVFGMLMGFFLGAAKLCENNEYWSGRRLYLALSILVPALAHGIYDYTLSVNSQKAALFFFLFILCVDIMAFFAVNRASGHDSRL